MDYRDCLKYLDSLGQELHGIQWGLETITQVLARLGNPHLKYPTAIVAGTNGKGSTAAMLASILIQAGYRTGLYTSPHLVRVNERIQVNGAEISEDDFARTFTEVRQVVEGLLKEKTLRQLPSFFEFLTAAGFHYFAQAGVSFAVLEVGMGGRLDATNVTQPRVAVITNVGLDHVEFLGSTLAQIGREKAGVIKLGTTVVCGCEQGEAAGRALGRVPRAQLAFKDSMVHGILQFTPRIAFRYVLHRCESRDIRCRESYFFFQLFAFGSRRPP